MSAKHHVTFHVMALYFSKIFCFFLLMGFGGRGGLLQGLGELWREGWIKRNEQVMLLAKAQRSKPGKGELN